LYGLASVFITVVPTLIGGLKICPHNKRSDKKTNPPNAAFVGGDMQRKDGFDFNTMIANNRGNSNTNGDKPKYLRVNPAGIPGELKALPQWVLWRAELRGGKWSKAPYRIDGRRASSTNPDDWTSFDRAIEAYVSPGPEQHYEGVGFVFASGGRIVGIDLDHVIGESGNIEPWARRIIQAAGSYCELSVSGTGMHIFVRGELPDGKGRRRGRIELYDRARYFTASGAVYGEPLSIQDAHTVITKLLDWMAAKDGAATRGQPTKPQYAGQRRTLPDDILLRKAATARNGYKFARLWQGDTSDYGGDDSRADLALLSILLYWTNGDEARADELFRQSGLMRDKWERREDYRRRCFGFLAGRGRGAAA
jgi:primase-polymerase (primpol)-like protein